jgi:chromate transporter
MTGPTRREIFRVWLALGAQSFGGGSATLALIRRAMIDQKGWLTDAEFVRDWALCQVTPGINLLGITILIGRRLGGAAGIALALTGLLLPSVSITVLITACYAHFQGLAAVKSAVRGIIPATVGLGLLTAYQMGLPLLAVSRREGRITLLVGVFLLLGSALIAALWMPPVVGVLCTAGAVGAFTFWIREVRRRRKKS